eukprot:ANDGO_08422.mRNA.1 Serine protease/ABC transporter B family protein tagC
MDSARLSTSKSVLLSLLLLVTVPFVVLALVHEGGALPSTAHASDALLSWLDQLYISSLSLQTDIPCVIGAGSDISADTSDISEDTESPVALFMRLGARNTTRLLHSNQVLTLVPVARVATNLSALGADTRVLTLVDVHGARVQCALWLPSSRVHSESVSLVGAHPDSFSTRFAQSGHLKLEPSAVRKQHGVVPSQIVENELVVNDMVRGWYRTPMKDLQSLLLSSSVRSVHVSRKVSLRNGHAHNACQAGSHLAAEDGQLWNPDVRYFSDVLGVDGTGEILGCADTGIDFDHCFFYDPDHSVQLNKFNPAHRKIVQYIPFGDAMDDSDGHGTHVVGSLVGQCTDSSVKNTISNYGGAAYGAKLAFFDIGITPPGSGSPTLVLPNNLVSGLFGPLYDAGARVMSISWGVDENTYDELALMIDDFLWRYRASVVFIAAGNTGAKGLGSVGTPATSKNAVAVGATRNTVDWISIGNADFGPDLAVVPFWTSSSDIVWVPGSACVDSDLSSNPGATWKSTNGTVPAMLVLSGSRSCFIPRGDCAFFDKILRAQHAGCRSVGIFNTPTSSTDLPTMGVPSGSSPYSVLIPSILVSYDVKAKLVSGEMSHISAPLRSATASVTSEASAESNLRSRASFSSQGPAMDGRFKPEIASPGLYVFSSRSDRDTGTRNCNLKRLQGTSMATPIAASNAGLLRQYLIKYNHVPSASAFPSGSVERILAGLSPSGALLRAGVIASGTSGVPTSPLGFGSMQLADAVPSSSANTSLIVIDAWDDVLHGLQQTGSSASIRLQAYASGSLRVVLTWADPPSHLVYRTTTKTMVNDLDLTVTLDQPAGTPTVLSNDDHTNTAERIDAQVTLGQIIHVAVRATSLQMAPQGFALWIVGPVLRLAANSFCPASILYPSTRPVPLAAPCDMSTHVCVDHRCVCVSPSCRSTSSDASSQLIVLGLGSASSLASPAFADLGPMNSSDTRYVVWNGQAPATLVLTCRDLQNSVVLGTCGSLVSRTLGLPTSWLFDASHIDSATYNPGTFVAVHVLAATRNVRLQWALVETSSCVAFQSSSVFWPTLLPLFFAALLEY